MLQHPTLSPAKDVLEVDGRWVELTSPGMRRRFTQIMQRMDDRYDGLELGIDAWLNGLAASGQFAELYGWGLDNGSPEGIVQVVALSSRRTPDRFRTQPRIRMLGVDPDAFSSAPYGDEVISTWIVRYLRLLHDLLGSPVEVAAMRPKSMSFKPMERLHDFVRSGISFDVSDSGRQVLCSATVIDERDHGQTLFWRVALAEVPS